MDTVAKALDAISGADVVTAPLRGRQLLDEPLWNKGTAFSDEERTAFGLHGLLPPQIETLDEQVSRAYQAYAAKTEDLERHIYLRALQDTNEVLFYRLILEHLPEMMPMIYTPVVGLACQRFSEIYRRPRGLFVSYPQREWMDAMLDAVATPEPQVIVVTDGERILGLGDQGVGGMGIPIGKLSLYTACGGIDPVHTLPVVLDVGTNNQALLDDPYYIGWRHERVGGEDYYAFVDRFVEAVVRRFPNVLLQWEDFAQPHAAPLLAKYRDRLCTFNDDIQGTAAVALGTLMAACRATGVRLADQRIAVLGAGSAGCGIAEEIAQGLESEGLSESEARSRLYMVDRAGLLLDGMSGLMDFQAHLAQHRDAVQGWTMAPDGTIGLQQVIENAKPTVLIGVAGVPGLFTEAAIRAMAGYAERPIVMPLSNPTSRVEATPADLLAWTDGRAVVATGSPFAPVEHDGRRHVIAQCNNSYIFPGMGLAVRAVAARRVTDEMFLAAARVLASCAPAIADPAAALLPPLSDVRSVSAKIAVAAAETAIEQGHAEPVDDLEARVAATMWAPEYHLMRPA